VGLGREGSRGLHTARARTAAASTPIGPRARLYGQPTPAKAKPWSASKSTSAHALAWAALSFFWGGGSTQGLGYFSHSRAHVEPASAVFLGSWAHRRGIGTDLVAWMLDEAWQSDVGGSLRDGNW
jgi:hypothetical protein